MSVLRILSRNLSSTPPLFHQITMRAASNSTLNSAEVEKFSRMAEDWWNPSGVCKPLHSMNSLRVPLIRERLARTNTSDKPLDGIKILDIGCGGGILSESLARLGANVTGVDACQENINIAQVHASKDSEITSRLEYVCSTVEDYKQSLPSGGIFDAVVASEVIEHVDSRNLFLKTVVDLTKEDGGSIFITTINRTNRSWLAAIIGGEYVLRILPVGTHDWNKFVKPEEIEKDLDELNCSTRLVNGMLYIPGVNSWAWIPDKSVNYALHAVRHKIEDISSTSDKS